MTGVVVRDIVAMAGRLPFSRMDEMERLFGRCDRLYFYGAGRSGLVLRMFAMRLMHLGYSCHVVGEATAPAIAARDLLVVASGSGRTPTVRAVVDQARAAGATTMLLTATTDAPLLSEVAVTVTLPGTHKYEDGASEQPPGSLFEQMLLCFLEETVCLLMRTRGIGPRAVMARHANLE